MALDEQFVMEAGAGDGEGSELVAEQEDDELLAHALLGVGADKDAQARRRTVVVAVVVAQVDLSTRNGDPGAAGDTFSQLLWYNDGQIDDILRIICKE
ncbi:hypothetical protein ACHAWF_016680 [Thalassiosira exigua]